MTALYFNGHKVDLGTAVISETRQINSFFDLKDRQTNFTNKFTLPETPRNRAIMDMFGVVGSNSTIPYKINTVSVFRNGIPTIQNGKAIVSRIKYGKGYSVSIQYGNYSLYDAVDNKELADLNLEALNHTFTINTLFDSYTHTWQDGYIYSVADFGFLSSNTNGLPIDARYQVPSLSRKWIWNTIFEEAGFTYTYVGENNPFESEAFENSFFTVTTPQPNIIGQTVNFSAMLTGISQKAFIKSVMQDFALILDKVENTNTYRFISIDDLVQGEDNRIDLSTKFHAITSIDTRLKGYAKQNYLRYNYDEDEDDYADGAFLTNNETVTDEKTLFTSPFKVPKQSSVTINNVRVFEFAKYTTTLNDDGTLKEVKTKKSKPYLHAISRRSAQIRYTFDNNTTNIGTGVVPFASLQGMNYNEIISTRYSAFTDILERIETITAVFALNAIDVKQFDFFDKVYIKQLSAYYYMNKIKNFKPSKLTTCELIKINIDPFRGEYNNDYSNDYLL